MTRGALLLGLGCAAGCAHLDGELTPPDRAVVAQYAAVRAGQRGAASVDGYHFDRTAQGVVASRRLPRVADEEAYEIGDASIAAGVAHDLRFDPALAQSRLSYRVADHAVYLSGAADDAAAAQAVFDALRLPGVSVVFAEYDRPVAR